MSISISIYNIKGTARVLKPAFLHLSPAVGLLASCNSSLISNLRKLQPGFSQSSEVARLLFYQREDQTGRTVGAVSSSKSRSNIAFWLSPKSIGHILGLSLSSRARKGKLTAATIDAELRSMGIHCNTVNGHWSGVSLERYRKLVRLISEDNLQSLDISHGLSTGGIGRLVGYATPLMLRLLLEKASSKQCFLDYFAGLEAGLAEDVMLEENASLRSNGSVWQRKWLEDKFMDHELVGKRVALAATEYFRIGTNNSGDKPIPQIDLGCNLEIIATSLAKERSFKPAIRLGRYALEDGPAKPDCVEVCVREIIEALIFNAQLQGLDSALLPASAHPKLRQLYANDNACIVLGTSAVGVPACLPKNNLDIKTKEPKAVIIEGDDMGQAWFEMCSNVSQCSYLSQTPSGIPYELKPTIQNVCRMVGHLLGANESWNQLSQLELFWNSHQDRQGGSTGDTSRINSHISINTNIVSFRAALSDTEMIHREVATVKLHSRNHELILELEEAHGLAAVKHNRSGSSEMVWEGNLVKLISNDWMLRFTLNCILEQPARMTQYLISSTLMAGQLMNIADSENKPRSEGLGRAMLHAIFACPWGEEALHDAFVDEQGKLVINDGALTNATSDSRSIQYAKRIEKVLRLVCSSISHTTQDVNADRRSTDAMLEQQCVPMLEWVLLRCFRGVRQDSISHESIGKILRSLPRSLLNHPRIVQAVHQSPSLSNIAIAYAFGADEHRRLFKNRQLQFWDYAYLLTYKMKNTLTLL